MTHRLGPLAAALVLLSTGGCSGVHSIAREGVVTRTLVELQADMAEGAGHYALPPGGLIVRVPAGTRLPLRLQVDTPFPAVVEPGDNHVRLDRDVWFYLRGRQMALSPDGERWADIGRWKAVARLFGGGGGGSFSVGAGITREEGPAIHVVLQVAGPAK